VAHRGFPAHRGRDLLDEARGDVAGPPWGWAVTLEMTGTAGADNFTLASSACSFGWALAMSGEW